MAPSTDQEAARASFEEREVPGLVFQPGDAGQIGTLSGTVDGRAVRVDADAADKVHITLGVGVDGRLETEDMSYLEPYTDFEFGVAHLDQLFPLARARAGVSEALRNCEALEKFAYEHGDDVARLSIHGSDLIFSPKRGYVPFHVEGTNWMSRELLEQWLPRLAELARGIEAAVVNAPLPGTEPEVIRMELGPLPQGWRQALWGVGAGLLLAGYAGWRQVEETPGAEMPFPISVVFVPGALVCLVALFVHWRLMAPAWQKRTIVFHPDRVEIPKLNPFVAAHTFRYEDVESAAYFTTPGRGARVRVVVRGKTVHFSAISFGQHALRFAQELDRRGAVGFGEELRAAAR